MIYGPRDHTSIENIVKTRLGTIPGVEVWTVKIINKPDCMKVKVIFVADDMALRFRSRFELPLACPKELILNEVDEIAESIKTARLEHKFTTAKPSPVMRPIKGTGLRGKWKDYPVSVLAIPTEGNA